MFKCAHHSVLACASTLNSLFGNQTQLLLDLAISAKTRPQSFTWLQINVFVDATAFLNIFDHLVENQSEEMGG